MLTRSKVTFRPDPMFEGNMITSIGNQHATGESKAAAIRNLIQDVQTDISYSSQLLQNLQVELTKLIKVDQPNQGTENAYPK